jgi:thiol-disulfide isomerase/thioredoxin
MAMPGIQKLHEKYAGKPVRIFGVNCREKSRAVDAAAFVRELGFTYPQLLDGDRVALDYRVRGIPAFYLIGPDGKVLFAQAGFTPAAEDQISRLIDETLKALPSASAAGG